MSGRPHTTPTQRHRRGAAAAFVLALVSGAISAAPAAAADPSRLQGETRYDTAAAVALSAFPSGAPVAYLARGDTFPDALAAGALADGPVLLVPPSAAVPTVVASALSTLAPTRVVALGGPAAVSDDVLTSAAGARTTSRLAGNDRYGTAVEISKAAFGSSVPPTVYLARGDSFPDALAAGVVTDGPVLLVPGSGPVPPAIVAEVQRLQPQKVVALGGTAVLPEAVLSAVAGGRATARLAGADRYATSAAISAAAFPTGASTVYLARGDTFPDALAAGALKDGPILLVPSCGSLPAPVAAEITRLAAAKVVALGGPGAVCDQLLTAAATGAPSEATYLSEARAVTSSGSTYEEPTSINGVVHARSIRHTVYGKGSGSTEYDLARGAARFRATAGLSDLSPTANGRVQFDVFADGRSIYSKQLGLGEAEALDLDVTGVLRLRLVATGLGDGTTLPSFGNARTIPAGSSDDVSSYTSARAASPVSYLSEQREVTQVGSIYTEAASISGTPFARSVRFTVYGKTAGLVEYDLGRAYKKLSAQIGLADNSTSQGSAQMDVFLDGKRIATHQVTLGQAVPLNLDVTNGLRLRLQVTGLTTGTIYPSFGGIRVEP